MGQIYIADNSETPISLRGTSEEDWIVFSQEAADELGAILSANDPIDPTYEHDAQGPIIPEP